VKVLILGYGNIARTLFMHDLLNHKIFISS